MLRIFRLLLLLIATTGTAGAEDCNRAADPAIPWTWAEDENYEILPQGSDNFRFIGDRIRVNKNNFPSVSRSPRDAAPNIHEITFDGREILVEAPISLESGRVRFIADQIVFSSSAQITLARPAPVLKDMNPADLERWKSGDGLTILARKVTFGDIVEIPINFFTSGPRNGAAPRQLTLITEELWIRGKRIPTEAAEDAVRRLTLNSVFNRDYGPASEVIVGPNAVERYRRELENSSAWPMAFASKLARFHAMAPYDGGYNRQIEQLATNYMPLFSSLDSPGPAKEVQSILNQIALKIDSLGFSSTQTPRISLEQAISNANEKLSRATGGPLAVALEAQILARYESKALDRDKLAGVRQEKEEAETQLAGAQRAIDDNLTKLAILDQSISGVWDRILASRERIARELDDMKRQDHRHWEDAQRLRWVAAAATILPMSAPVGIAIATGANLASDAVYHRPAGPDESANGSFLVTFEQAYEKAKSFKEKAALLRESWETFNKSRKLASSLWRNEQPGKDVVPKGGKIPSKAEAAAQLGTSALKFAQAADGLLKETSLPQPVQIAKNELEEKDPELTKLLEEHRQLNSDRGQIVSELDLAQGKILELNDRTSKLAIAEAELLVARPNNERRIAAEAATADNLRSSLFTDVYRSAAILRRSALYANLNPSIARMDQDDFPQTIPAPKDLNLNSLDRAWAQKRLTDENQRATVSLRRLIGRVIAEQQTYEARQNSRQFEEVVTVFAQENRADNTSALFLNALNKAIRDQIEAASLGVTQNYSSPLLLPVAFRPGDNALRLVTVRPTEIRFKDRASLEGKVIYLRVIHPGFGRMIDQGRCQDFDFRLGAASSYESYFDTPVTSALTLPSKATMISENVAINAEYLTKLARLPLRAPYFLSVLVTGDAAAAAWKRVPEVEELQMTHIAIR